MAGLFDTIGNTGEGILGYLRSMDKATEPFMGDYWKAAGGGKPGGVNLLDYLSDLDKRSSTPFPGYLDPAANPSFIGGVVSGRQQPALNAPQSGDMGLMYGAAQQQPALNVPQSGDMGQWGGQTTQPAPPVAAPDAPSSTYKWGGGGNEVNVPLYGQPQQIDASAARRAVPQGPLTPQSAAPTSDSELFRPKPTGKDRWDGLMGVLSPSVYTQNNAKKAQAETARGMYEVYIEQGFPPKVAAAKAIIAARNPDVLKEVNKPYANIEQRIANQPQGSRGGTQQGDPLQQISDLEGAKERGKKAAIAAEERATLARELPAFAKQAKEHIRQVEELRNHPGRKGNAWWHSKLSPYAPDASIPGNTDAFDANSRLNQIKGGAFLEAFKALKGGGQITEVEGKKATEAIARMNRAQSEKEFNAALDDYKGAIQDGLDKLHSTAGQSPPNQYKGGNIRTLPGGITIEKM